MEAVKNLIVILAGLAVAIATSVAVMINGWGVQPKSWTWIIGVSLAGHCVAQVLVAIAKSRD